MFRVYSTSPPSLRRLDSIMSADELLGLSDYSMVAGYHPSEDCSEDSPSYSPVIDLDLAFASPEYVYTIDERRRNQASLPVDHERSDEWLTGVVEEPSRKRHRGLSGRVTEFGRRARDSITEWCSWKPSAQRSKDSLLLASFSDINEPPSYRSSIGSQLGKVDFVSELRSLRSVVSFSGSAWEGWAPSDDTQSGIPHLYYAADSSAEAGRALAARIEIAVQQAFQNGGLAEAGRKLRFKLATGNNTSDSRQWKASAEHLRAVLAREAAVNAAFRRNDIYEAYAEDEDDEDEYGESSGE